MQHTVVKEFENDPNVVTVLFNQGGRGETLSWVKTFWRNNYLRGLLLWDAYGQAARSYYHPSTGLPFRRGFIIDPNGKVALPYFDYDSRMVIRSIKALRRQGLACVPAAPTLSQAAGGPLDLEVAGSPIRAGNVYATAVTLSGTTPGTVIEGVRVPINMDALTWLGLLAAGSPLFPRFIGNLDARGRATPAFAPAPGQIPAVLIGLKLWFAVVTFDALGLSTSPAAEVRIVK